MKINEFTLEVMKQADIYKAKPYTIDKQFYKAYKKAPLFNKSKYEKEVESLIYCYAYFMDANLGVGRILAIEDNEYCTDIEKIKEIADKLKYALLNSSEFSNETQQFLEQYQKDKLGFDALIPCEICGNVKAHICPLIFSYDDLPNKQIPSHRFMPCFMLPNTVKDETFMIINLIPKKFYEL